MTRQENPAAKANAGWSIPYCKTDRLCRKCKHCGTAREIGVVCKHPLNDFCDTDLDATCKRFEPRGA